LIVNKKGKWSAFAALWTVSVPWVIYIDSYLLIISSSDSTCRWNLLWQRVPRRYWPRHLASPPFQPRHCQDPEHRPIPISANKCQLF
jgi:hypothetical protein